jgi:hypothetical protein
MAMATENAIETTVNTSYLVHGGNGNVKVVVTNKTEKQAKTGNTNPSTALFAKNTRYSIYNNGGGYTGL